MQEACYYALTILRRVRYLDLNSINTILANSGGLFFINSRPNFVNYTRISPNNPSSWPLIFSVAPFHIMTLVLRDLITL